MRNYIPELSFCIATYRRPQILAKTLRSILSQLKNVSIEIVVSDNDPEKSALITCRKLQKEFLSQLKKTNSSLKYVFNEVSGGMVPNFTNAFNHSKGKYICFMADDDPPTEDLIDTVFGLMKSYPDKGCYYGACWVEVTDDKIASRLGLIKGRNNFSNPDRKKNEVTEYYPVGFLKAFLKNEIFPYMLWSSGIVERKLVAVFPDPMPDYGTAFLTDMAFMLRSGAQKGCVVINKPLGIQTIHNLNFGRSEVDELSTGIARVFKYTALHIKNSINQGDWRIISPMLAHFFLKWTMNHILSVAKLQSTLKGQQRSINSFIGLFKRIIISLSLKDTLYGKYLLIQLKLRLAVPILFDAFFLTISGAVFKYIKRNYLRRY